MRRATAVRRLRVIAERCHQVCELWEPGHGLVEVFTFGPVLDPADEDASVEVIQLALVVEHDPAELTWGSRPPTFSGLPYVLDLEKAPVDWYFRPAGQPVSNHRIVRPLRIWSREAGVDEEALAALVERDDAALDRLREAAPRPAVVQRQLAEDLVAATAWLQQVRDRYWSRGWRQAHHAAGTLPENHLWDAVNGYLDLLAATGGAPTPIARPEGARKDPGRPETGRPETGRSTSGPTIADPAQGRPAPADPAKGEGPELVVAPPLIPDAELSPAGTARRTRRAAGPARRRGSRGAPPDS